LGSDSWSESAKKNFQEILVEFSERKPHDVIFREKVTWKPIFVSFYTVGRFSKLWKLANQSWLDTGHLRDGSQTNPKPMLSQDNSVTFNLKIKLLRNFDVRENNFSELS
jgi:hypothetical protein